MKLSLAPLALLLVAACSSDPQPPAPPSAKVEPDAGSPAPVVSKRTFVERSLFATSPENLLIDPEFSITELQWGGFIAFQGQSFVQPRIGVISTPAGAARRTTFLPATYQGEDAVMLAPFVGVAQALEASVWLSACDARGNAVDEPVTARAALTADGYSLTIDKSALALEPDEASRIVVAGRTWIRHVARTAASSFERGGQFVLMSGSGATLVLAPEVKAVAAQDVHRSRTSFRALAHAEQKALQRYAAIRPRLGEKRIAPPRAMSPL